MRTKRVPSAVWPACAIFAVLLVACASYPPFAADWEPGKDVPYVPTPPGVVEAMLKLAGVTRGDFVVDLGCGDGRIVVAAAKEFGARGRGVDFNPARVQEARENARRAGVAGRVEFLRGDLFDADVRDASVVTLYLLPKVNLRLRPKLLRDLKVGARIVSHSFDMGDWRAEKTVEVGARVIRLWTVTEQAKGAYGGG